MIEEERDLDQQRVMRELVARFAPQFSEAALRELAGRLLLREGTRTRWEILVGEIVACAVYNQLSLTDAEEIIVRKA